MWSSARSAAGSLVSGFSDVFRALRERDQFLDQGEFEETCPTETDSENEEGGYSQDLDCKIWKPLLCKTTAVNGKYQKREAA